MTLRWNIDVEYYIHIEEMAYTKKKSCHYICCIQTSNSGYRIVWVQCILDWASKADTNEAVITLVHRLMVENVPESCVAFMATSKPCSKCCSWKIEWKKNWKEKKDTLLEFLIRTTLVSSIYSSKLELQGTLILVHHLAN